MTDTDQTQPATSHSPEPWWIDDEGFIAAGSGEPYATVADPQCRPTADCGEENEANGRRIVAAVNACRGLSTGALEQGVVGELREALGCLLDQIDTLKGESSCIDEDILKGEPYAAARAVIARAAAG
jgi:hypothetical protein